MADSEDTYGFIGEWWQVDIGLLHLRARWYDPASGTFLSVDPVESEPPYLYVRGNPTNLVDPSGYNPAAPGMTLICFATAPACTTALTAGAVLIGVTATGYIIYVSIDYLHQHPELYEVAYPAGPQPVAVPTVPAIPTDVPVPVIGTPPPCPYWSADGCKPVSNRRPTSTQVPKGTQVPTVFPTVDVTVTPDCDAREYLYHYTNKKGYDGVLNSGIVKPSPRGVLGPGLYMVDVSPQEARQHRKLDLTMFLFNDPSREEFVKYWIKIDVTDLNPKPSIVTKFFPNTQSKDYREFDKQGIPYGTPYKGRPYYLYVGGGKVKFVDKGRTEFSD